MLNILKNIMLYTCTIISLLITSLVSQASFNEGYHNQGYYNHGQQYYGDHGNPHYRNYANQYYGNYNQYYNNYNYNNYSDQYYYNNYYPGYYQAYPGYYQSPQLIHPQDFVGNFPQSICPYNSSSVCYTRSGHICPVFRSTYQNSWFSTCTGFGFLQICLDAPSFPQVVAQSQCYLRGTSCTCTLGIRNGHQVYERGIIR